MRQSFLAQFFKLLLSLNDSISVSQVVSAYCFFTGMFFKLNSKLRCFWSSNIITIFWKEGLL